MSHFGRSGPPDITDTYSLLILNISFRTTADDLFLLFDKYGKVVDVFIPKDRRTGESRGFAFVRYKYADEAQKAVDKLDGRGVDGREIGVQFAKYGPNAERIDRGKIAEPVSKIRRRSRSRSPRPREPPHGRQPRSKPWGRHVLATTHVPPVKSSCGARDSNTQPFARGRVRVPAAPPRYRDEYRDRDYRRRSCSRSRGRYDRDRNRDRERSYRHRSRTYSASPDRRKNRRSPKYDDEDRSRSGSYRSSSCSPRKAEHERSPSPNQRPSTLESPDVRNGERVSKLHRDAQ